MVRPVMLIAYLLLATQAAYAATSPPPLPDYVHDKTAAQAEVPIPRNARRIGAASEPWSPPAQATWSGTAAPLRVVLSARRASMRSEASLSMDLLAMSDGVAVSPFLQATRGIGFEVRSMTGELVVPAEPMPGSPPPPALAPDQLTALGRTRPFHVNVREKTRTIFPGPGLYRIRAIVTLFDPGSTPARYARAVSAPVIITVTR